MEKQKKILYISLSILSAIFIADIVLFIISVISVIFFAVAFSLLFALIIANVALLVWIYYKLKKKNSKKVKLESTGDINTDLYTALGIPIQYNKDGTVKDIYQLLGIEPIYDEEGKRVLTAYELLGILPKFNEKGEEIPYVFAIKNGVKRIAKVDLSSRVLTRKLTESEKEEMVIRETLKKKLSEAEQSGDKQKEVAIKKALTATKKPEEKKPEYKPIKYTMGKGSNPIKPSTVPQSLSPNKIANTLSGSIFDIFAGSASRGSHGGAKPQPATLTSPQDDKIYHDPNLLTPPPPRSRPVPNPSLNDPFAFSIKIRARVGGPDKQQDNKIETIPNNEFETDINAQEEGMEPELR